MLKEVYFDAVETIRHYDNQRANFTQIALSALAVLAGFAIVNATPEKGPIFVRALAALGGALSILSLLVVSKLHQLIDRQRGRARLALEGIEENEADKPVLNIDRAIEARSKEYLLGRISLRTIWSLIFVIFAIGYVFLLVWPDTVIVSAQFGSQNTSG